ncbi:MAG: dTMP kinase [Acidimicrobiales bacterium]
MTAFRRGRLVALEGGEACGKSTQAARLAERLGATLTREPGGTGVGERIRALLLDVGTAGLGDRAEALLLAAARAQHVAEVVGPALAAGGDVVTDRFVGSFLAYQGFGRRLPLGELRAVSAFATAGIAPDVVVVLDVPAEVAAARKDRPPDRLEAAGAGFHRRVVEGFLALAAEDPSRWTVVDGTGPIDDVAQRVWAAVAPRLLPAKP